MLVKNALYPLEKHTFGIDRYTIRIHIASGRGWR